MQTLERIELRQTRDFGQKIGATVTFLRLNFKPLFKILLYKAGPLILITGICTWYFQLSTNYTRGGDVFSGLASSGSIFLAFALLMIASIIGFSVLIGVTYHYMLEYMENPGKAITSEDIWPKVKKDLPMLMGTSFLCIVITGFATMLFFIPGLYVSVLFSPILIIRLHERVSFTNAISRCRFLMENKWWSTFGLIMILSLIIGVISMVFAIPNGIAIFLTSLHSVSTQGGDELPGMQVISLVTTVISTLGSTLLYAPLMIAIGFQYFNLVERKESIGLMSRLNTLGVKKDRTEDAEESY